MPRPTRTEVSIFGTAHGRRIPVTSLEHAMVGLGYNEREARRVFELVARDQHQRGDAKQSLPQHTRMVVREGMTRYKLALEAARSRFR